MIHHVTREVAPELLEPCLAFYRLLGFRRVEPPATLVRRAAWLTLGPTQLHLMPRAGAGAVTGHVAILARDYEATVARLRDAGHEVEPRQAHWGASRSYVRDPQGNLVELMASAPDA